jgi:DNA-binding transcriptional ArsR family regulator
MVNHMVNHSDSLSAVFSALADPTRRTILERLAGGRQRVTELAAPFAISLPAISKHLRVLENAGLLTREKEGRNYHCRLQPEALASAAEWIAHYRRFWDEQLGALDRFLTESATKEKSAWKKNRQLSIRRSKSPGHSPPRGKKSSRRGRNRKS